MDKKYWIIYGSKVVISSVIATAVGKAVYDILPGGKKKKKKKIKDLPDEEIYTEDGTLQI